MRAGTRGQSTGGVGQGEAGCEAEGRVCVCVWQQGGLAGSLQPVLVFGCFEVSRVSRLEDQSKLSQFDGRGFEPISLNVQQALVC